MRSVDKALVVLDTECFGLKRHHAACEIAYWALDTGERGRFVPPFDEVDIRGADPHALAVNRFYERGLDKDPQDVDGSQLRKLHGLLTDSVIVGSNPGFDAGKVNYALLRQFPQELGLITRYELFDLRYFAANVLGLTGNLPGLLGLCELLGIEPGKHTAESDVTAAGECFYALRQRGQVLAPRSRPAR